jgi:hypothetical protein
MASQDAVILFGQNPSPTFCRVWPLEKMHAHSRSFLTGTLFAPFVDLLAYYSIISKYYTIFLQVTASSWVLRVLSLRHGVERYRSGEAETIASL